MPETQEEKIRAILDAARPYIEGEGLEFTLREVKDGVATLTMSTKAWKCASNLVTMRLAVEQRILTQLEEIERVEIVEA